MIKLTNEDIRNIILKEIRSCLKEGKLVDNFDWAEKNLEFNDGEFYYVEIIERKKDNPDGDFNYRRYWDYFTIHSPQELIKYKPEIISQCERHNARAYLYPNARNEQQTRDYAKSLQRRNLEMGRTFQFAAGRHMDKSDKINDWVKLRPKGIIDVDSDDPKVHNQVRDMLKQNNIEIAHEYESPNGGLHIITKNRDASRLDFSSFDGGKKLGRYAKVGFDGDSPMILYSNVNPQGYKPAPQWAIRKYGHN